MPKIDPEHGKSLNKWEAAAYLGVPLCKFERIARDFPPDYLDRGVNPYWSQKVLDILPDKWTKPPDREQWTHEEAFKRGKACGVYLIAEMEPEEIRRFRSGIGLCQFSFDSDNAEKLVLLLEEHGVQIRFRVPWEAKPFKDGLYSAIRAFASEQASGMTPEDKQKYVREFWGGGSYEGGI